MSSYFIPTATQLSSAVFSPAQLIIDAAFDQWLTARNFDFVMAFNEAYRAGQTSLAYTYQPPSSGEADGVQHTQMNYLVTTLRGYGYTVTDAVRPGPGVLSGWVCTVTIPNPVG